MSREINNIVIHCTATPQDTTIESILRYWLDDLGWNNPGYHFIIEADGTVSQLQQLSKPSNGVRGHNHDSIHISWIGGEHGDNRSIGQRLALEAVVKALKAVYVDAEIKGHRDFPNVSKSCPQFSVEEWVVEIGLIN